MPTEKEQRQYLARIERALQAATEVARQYSASTCRVHDNGGRDVITEVDRRLSGILRGHLLESGEGWLSEEDTDDRARLACEVVWVVDPLDGTREFVDGIPEWCISVGLVVGGTAVAGGTSNPATGESFLGSLDCGVSYNGQAACVTTRDSLDGAVILASRQEHKRGEWQRFADSGFEVRPVGSVAYKLSLVAAGLADATWTLCPKHEWDLAAGVALVTAAGGCVASIHNASLRFNRSTTLLPGLVASGKALWPNIDQLLCRV
jgi:myo-inositol-1(or 4)-monophosphatase